MKYSVVDNEQFQWASYDSYQEACASMRRLNNEFCTLQFDVTPRPPPSISGRIQPTLAKFCSDYFPECEIRFTPCAGDLQILLKKGELVYRITLPEGAMLADNFSARLSREFRSAQEYFEPNFAR